MVLSGCISITKPVIPLASLPTNSSHRSPPRKPPKISTCQPSNTQQIQPSAAEIERAIGAGIYRDHDPASTSDPAEKSIFDAVLSNSIGKTEGKTEQALREAGEWLNKQTEKTTRSSGRKFWRLCFFGSHQLGFYCSCLLLVLLSYLSAFLLLMISSCIF